jgi:hypothetical protein
MKSAVLFIVLLLYASPSWAVNASVRIDGGENVVSLTDVTISTTAVLIASSNSRRAALNCTTTANVRWGDSGISTTKGQLLQANGSIEIKNSDSIYMVSELGDATISCTEETWDATSSSSPIFSP